MITNLRRNQKLRKLFFFTIGVLWGLTMITYSSQSFAADLTLSLSNTQGSPNQTVPLTLSLSYPGGATASAFQLDINYDTSVLENPSAVEGEVLINAEKRIDSSQPSSGVFRIIASGHNQNIIQAGSAATVSFHIKPTAPPGQTNLTLSNLLASDPDGLPLDPLGNGASINVIAAAVPTLSEWGIIIFITVIMGIGVVMLRKRRLA